MQPNCLFSTCREFQVTLMHVLRKLCFTVAFGSTFLYYLSEYSTGEGGEYIKNEIPIHLTDMKFNARPQSIPDSFLIERENVSLEICL
ncbi:hypothetical protein T10_6145 [Trichinella papuae]|uniref:Uncharacterized protein n=1 Tax=Trichinella papuae TaxID=268474 RepID=A0A0V1MH65_9BILA|nr:hypothetical protein T10_11721 [Trichinella papuae]KRZ71159.1 hypothetical protein T10_6145 [Trichinella papuae]